MNQITVGCTDYPASCAFYTALGLRQIVGSPDHYARFETEVGETLSIERVDRARVWTTIVFFECDDLDETLRAVPAAGLRRDHGARVQSWGWREARLRDPDGNRICLFHAGSNRRFPPWRIENSTSTEEKTS